MKIQRVVEFVSVDELNKWLTVRSVNNLITIKKISRSPINNDSFTGHKEYFVWYEEQTITTS